VTTYTYGFTTTENPISDGGNWASDMNAWSGMQATGGEAGPPGDSASYASRCAVDVGASHYMEAVVSSSCHPSQHYMAFFVAAPSGGGTTWIAVESQTGSVWNVYETTGQLDSGSAVATFSGTLAAGDTVRLEWDGTTLTLKVNGGTVGTHTPSTPPTGHYCGIADYQNSGATETIVDSFTAASLGGGPIERTLSDSVNIADAPASDFGIPLTELLAVLDTLAADVSAGIERLLVDGVVISDDSPYELDIIAADTIEVQDLSGRLLELGRVVSDAIGLDDHSRRDFVLHLLSEGLGVSDRYRADLALRMSERIVVADSLQAGAAAILARLLIDGFTVGGDAVSSAQSSLLTDNIGLDDAIRVETAGLLALVLTDAIPVGDRHRIARSLDRTGGDGIGLGDDASLARVLARRLLSAVRVSDAVTRHAEVERLLSELITLTDGSSYARTLENTTVGVIVALLHSRATLVAGIQVRRIDTTLTSGEPQT